MNAIEKIEKDGFGHVDIEMHDVINKLNLIPGIETIDCCFGHPSSGVTCNHHSNWFIGLKATDLRLFDVFWARFFSRYVGKTDTPTGWVQFTMHQLMYYPFQGITLKCGSEHDPAIDERGNEEKVFALKLLCEFIDEKIR